MDGSSRWLAPGPLDVTGDAAWVRTLSRWSDRLPDEGIDVLVLEALRDGSHRLDPFVVAGALLGAGAPLAVGVITTPGQGRAASVMARELTALDHLGPHGTALVLVGSDATRLEESVAVITALMEPGLATAGGSMEHVSAAPNLPGPRTHGGPPVLVISGADATQARAGSGEEADELSWDIVDIDADALGAVGGIGATRSDRTLLRRQGEAIRVGELSALRGS